MRTADSWHGMILNLVMPRKINLNIQANAGY